MVGSSESVWPGAALEGGEKIPAARDACIQRTSLRNVANRSYNYFWPWRWCDRHVSQKCHKNCGLHAELEWEETGSSPTNLEVPWGAFGVITLEFPYVIVKSVKSQWHREMRFNFWSQPFPGEWKEGFLWGRYVRHGGAPAGFPLRKGLDPEPWGLGSSGSPPALSMVRICLCP